MVKGIVFSNVFLRFIRKSRRIPPSIIHCEVFFMAEKIQTKAKKTVGIIVNVILWLFVVFAVVVTIFAVSANASAKNVPTIGGKCYLSVLSDSMNAEKPTGIAADKPNGFKKGSMLISEYICDSDAKIDALEVGDIITFEYDINGDGKISSGEYNTHRIISINRSESGNILSVVTRGDNVAFNNGASETVSRNRIIARYTGKKIAGVGSVFSFLGSRLGFGICILLPLVAFFGYQLVVFIMTVLKLKNGDKKVITAADEEEIKQRAIEEYLRKQAEQSAESAETPGSDQGGKE